MRVLVRKWDNSASVRILAAAKGAAKLSLDQQVDIHKEAGRVIIEPTPKSAFNLVELLAAVTDEMSLIDDFDPGPARRFFR